MSVSNRSVATRAVTPSVTSLATTATRSTSTSSTTPQGGKPQVGSTTTDSFVGGSKSLGTQSTQLVASRSGIPPTVEVGMVARDAVSDMNRNGNRAFSGLGSTSAWFGNIVDNASSMVGVRNRWWKCEDQAPYLAERINQANIPGVRAGVQNSNSHSWVVVNVGGRENRDGSVSGGQNYYIDPWASGADFVRQPETPVMTTWDRSIIRGNIEPDAPR